MTYGTIHSLPGISNLIEREREKREGKKEGSKQGRRVTGKKRREGKRGKGKGQEKKGKKEGINKGGKKRKKREGGKEKYVYFPHVKRQSLGKNLNVKNFLYLTMRTHISLCIEII